MKVLVTGFTKRQCNEPVRAGREYRTVFGMVVEAMRYAGHEVDWRAVDVGEKLDHDVAFIGLHAMAGMGVHKHKFGAMWAGTQLPHVIAYQDWKIQAVAVQLHNENLLWRDSMIPDDGYTREQYDAALERSELFDHIRYRWSRNPVHTWCPMYNWADPKEHMWKRYRVKSQNWWTWDCDPFYGPNKAEPYPAFDKKRVWNCVSLSNCDKWLDRIAIDESGWELALTHREKQNTRLGGGGKGVEFRSEVQVVRDYDASWGVLMPYYFNACIPGWWRSRPEQSARSRCILYGDPADLYPMGEAFAFTRDEIEDMDANHLTGVAELQAKQHYDQQFDKDDSAANLTEMLHAVAS